MAYKRLIGSLIVKNGYLVKSYSYNFWRPAGTVSSALKILDSWKVDEIFIIDISANNGVDIKLLNEIKNSKITTPITYGGGIRNSDDIRLILDSGCDRILVETLLHDNNKNLIEINNIIGKQAIVASIPIYFDGNNFISWYHFKKYNQIVFINDLIKKIDTSQFSEYLFTDVNNEGNEGLFSLNLFDKIKEIDISILKHKSIFFGGINLESANIILNDSLSVGIAIGNVNLERELVIPKLRASLVVKNKIECIRKIKL
jgi:cyclase